VPRPSSASGSGLPSMGVVRKMKESDQAHEASGGKIERRSKMCKGQKGKRVTLEEKYMYLDEKRDEIHQMSWKTRSQLFEGHFYEDDVWSPICEACYLVSYNCNFLLAVLPTAG